jgi:hypothetical protein
LHTIGKNESGVSVQKDTLHLFFGTWKLWIYGLEFFFGTFTPAHHDVYTPLRLSCDIYLEFCFGILMGLRCPHTRLLRCTIWEE